MGKHLPHGGEAEGSFSTRRGETLVTRWICDHSLIKINLSNVELELTAEVRVAARLYNCGRSDGKQYRGRGTFDPCSVLVTFLSGHFEERAENQSEIKKVTFFHLARVGLSAYVGCTIALRAAGKLAPHKGPFLSLL